MSAPMDVSVIEKLDFNFVASQLQEIADNKQQPDVYVVDPKRVLWAYCVWIDQHKDNDDFWVGILGSAGDDNAVRTNQGAKDLKYFYWMGRDWTADDPLCIEYFNMYLARADPSHTEIFPPHIVSVQMLTKEQKDEVRQRFRENNPFVRYLSNRTYHVVVIPFLQKLRENYGLPPIAFYANPIPVQSSVWKQKLILPKSLEKLSFPHELNVFELDMDLDPEAFLYLKQLEENDWIPEKPKGGRPSTNPSNSNDGRVFTRTSTVIAKELAKNQKDLEDQQQALTDIIVKIGLLKKAIEENKLELQHAKEYERSEKMYQDTCGKSIEKRELFSKFLECEVDLIKTHNGVKLFKHVYATNGRSEKDIIKDLRAWKEKMEKERGSTALADGNASGTGAGQPNCNMAPGTSRNAIQVAVGGQSVPFMSVPLLNSDEGSITVHGGKGSEPTAATNMEKSTVGEKSKRKRKKAQ